MDRAEKAGLGVAIVGHAALFVALSLSLFAPPTLPKIENDPIEVQLVEEVAEQTRMPEPASAPAPPAPAAAPSLPPPPEPIEAPKPTPPVPAPRPEPAPVPKPTPKPIPKPRPVPKPVPKPVAKPAPKPAPKPVAKPAKPQDQSGRRRPDKSIPAATPPRPRSNSGLGDAMRNLGNPGAAPAKPGPAPRPTPAAKPGPAAIDAVAVKRALGSEIGRQLKPRWKAPTGQDVDQLVTILSWDLNKDGSLSGEPRFVSQGGGNASNAAQAAVHKENAIKAVRAAAPFKLPSEHYAYWKSVVSFRFDKRLSQ
jgi:outer membrane biosynthesis protein TonB